MLSLRLNRSAFSRDTTAFPGQQAGFCAMAQISSQGVFRLKLLFFW
jgi:hypothetical protein